MNLDDLVKREASLSPAAPDPSAPRDPFDDLVRNEAGVNAGALDASLAVARGANPDEAAQRLKASRELGVPLDSLPQDKAALDDARSRIRFSAEDFQRTAPIAAKFLTDVNNAKVVGRDYDRLRDMELVGRAPNAMTNEGLKFLGRGASGISLGILTAIPATASAGYGILEGAGDFLSMFTRPLTQLRVLPQDIGGVISAESHARAQMYEKLRKDISASVADDFGGGPTASAAVSGLTSMGQMAMFAPAAGSAAIERGAVVGGDILARFFAGIAGGSAYSQAKEEGATVPRAAKHAIETAAFEYLPERVAGTELFKYLPDSFFKAVSRFVIADVLGEQATTLGQSFAEQINLHPEKPLSEFANLETRAEEAYQTLIATIVGGGGVISVQHLAGIPQKLAATDAKLTMERDRLNAVRNLFNAASDNPVLERSPEAFRDFMGVLTEDGVKEVYVSADKLHETFAQMGVTDDEVQRKLPEVAAQLVEGVSEVRVYTADLITYVTSPAAKAALLPELRAEPGGATFAQLQDLNKVITEQNEKMIDSMVERSTRDESFRANQKEVRDQIVEEMIGAGRRPGIAATDAITYTAFLSRIAVARGVPVSQVYAENHNIFVGPAGTRRENKMDPLTGHTLNVGLKVSESLGGGNLKPAEVIAALKAIGVTATVQQKHKSHTEDTSVLKLSRGLTPEEGHDLSVALKQDAISQYSNGELILVGPRAAEWGAADATQFMTVGGRYLQGVLAERQQAEELQARTQLAQAKYRTRDAGETLDQPAGPGMGGDGRAFTAFFTGVTQGKEGTKPHGTYLQVIDASALVGFNNEYQQHTGNFDMHIKSSIPGFGEVQQAVGDAIVKTYGEQGAKMLDIGASEGSLIKAITALSGGKIETLGLDPNLAMASFFAEHSSVPGSGYSMTALGSSEQEGQNAWTEDDGTEIKFFDPQGQKFDIVHEAMTFQFIGNDRGQQVARTKELMAPGGVALFEEKFYEDTQTWRDNEAKKDEYKAKYFTSNEISQKQKEILAGKSETAVVGMNDNMVPSADFEAVLAEQFTHVVQFWDSGNFKGYAASDDLSKLQALVGNMIYLNSEYSTVQTPRAVGVEDPTLAQSSTLGQSGLYSDLAREIPALIRIAGKDGKVKLDQALAWIAARQREGKFKQAEIEAVGLYEWLAIVGQEEVVVDANGTEVVPPAGHKVMSSRDPWATQNLLRDNPGYEIATREVKIPVADIVEFVAQNGVQVEDVMLSGEAVDEDLDVYLGQFETEEPDSDYLEEVARDSYLDDARQDIADREDIPLAEVNEGEAMANALARAEESYWSDGDAPANASARVDFAGQTFDYQVSYRYGEAEIYSVTRDEAVYQGRAIYDDRIKELIRDDVRAFAPQTSGDGGPTKFGDWRLPGGEDYRELLLTLPQNKGTYAGPHFDQDNIVAHVRFDTREGPNGEKVLFIQEIQSDWGQQGKKKGFGDKTGVPPAPFVTNTKDWTALAIKRVLRYAAENGFGSIALPTGQEQADRYSLSKHIGKLRYEGQMLRAYAPNGAGVWSQVVAEDKIADFVGDETAKKLLAQPDTNVVNDKQESSYAIRELSGLDLEVGGEGMKVYYDRIVPQVVNDIMKKLGVEQRAEMTGINTSPRHVIRMTPELKEKVMSGLPLFSRKGEFSPSTLTTKLMQGANFSTVQHEAAHYYLEVMTRMALNGTAPEYLVKELDRTLKWFGIEGDAPEARLAKWASMSVNEQRPHHETFAQSHERWLFEGKAPDVEMQGVFARFRAWFTEVYKSMDEFLQKNPAAGRLDDELRGIFSRLIASEDAIEYAEQIRGYESLFENEEAAGIAPKVFEKYIQTGIEGSQTAIAELQGRDLRNVKWMSNARDKGLAALQRQARAFRKELKHEVSAAVYAEPINQARRFLRKGEVFDPATGENVKALGGYKLDVAALEEMYPPGALGTPDLTGLRSMTGKQGLHPDMVAQMFGFSSGDALVHELLTAEKAADKIAGEVDRRMLEEHGEMIDARAIKLAVEAAIHNPARSRFLASGLKILTKSAIPVRDLVRAAKAAAERAVSGKKVRDIRPFQYAAAETRFNKEALKLVANDPKGAISAQRAALLNHHLAKASIDALEEVDGVVKYLKKFENLGTRKSIDIEYVEQIDSLLAPFDLSTGVSFKELARRTSLIAWVEQQEMLGFQPAIDAETIEMAKQKSYKDMTVEELRGFADAIKQVEHLGRMKKTLLTARDKREFAARMAEADASIIANANRTVPAEASTSDVATKIKETARGLAAEHRKMASYIREMDGGKDGGVMWELWQRGANEASDMRTELRAQSAIAVERLFAPILGTLRDNQVLLNLRSRKRLVPGTNISMTYEQRLMFGVNWGNEGNRQRIRDGGLAGKKALAPREVDAILDTLTHEDWQWVQSVLDYVGTFKEAIREQERQMTGVEPKWVGAAPIETKFGNFPGGYFPAKYDPKLSARSEMMEAVTDLRQAMRGAFGAAAANAPYAKARADAVVGRPILLNFDTLSRHIGEVTHRLAWQPWLTDANRTLRALEAPIVEHYGHVVLAEIRRTVEDIAVGDVVAKNGIESALNRLRTGSTIAAMGLRTMTALQQPSGLAQSWERIGGIWLAQGVKDFIAHPLEMAEFVQNKSMRMKHRARGLTVQREVHEVLGRIRTGDRADTFADLYFYPMAKTQQAVDTPTWLGAYYKGLAELGLENAASEDARKEIDDKAVALADQAVIDSQGSGEIENTPGIQRGHPFRKLFTSFISYSLTTYNRNIEAYRRTSFTDPADIVRFATDILILNTLPVIFTFALKELLKGNCGDDWECLAGKLAHEQTSFLLSQTVLTREAAAGVEAMTGGGYGYSGPAGLRFFADMYKFGLQVHQGELDAGLAKATINLAGPILHFPSGQTNATVDGIMAVENGEVEGAMILPALLVGPPRK